MSIITVVEGLLKQRGESNVGNRMEKNVIDDKVEL